MKKRVLYCLISLIVLITITGCNLITQTTTPNSLTKVRIGWQVPWALQGQIVQILKHTDILKQNGLEAAFVGRTYGPELNEAALAGEIDIVLTADQPAAALFSKNKGWIGIGRLMYNRTATYVPINSNIENINDLFGKTIGIPIGAAAERITLEALAEAGINPSEDVRILNVGIKEQIPLVNKDKKVDKWGEIDALSGFDPTPALFEGEGLVRTIHTGKVCSLVLMNEEFINENDDVAVKFMQAIIDAYDYYRFNVEQADKWFIEEAQLSDLNSDVLVITTSLEPNMKVESKEEIRVWLTDEDYEILQKAADFMEPVINTNVDMKKFVTNKYTNNNK